MLQIIRFPTRRMRAADRADIAAKLALLPPECLPRTRNMHDIATLVAFLQTLCEFYEHMPEHVMRWAQDEEFPCHAAVVTAVDEDECDDDVDTLGNPAVSIDPT